MSNFVLKRLPDACPVCNAKLADCSSVGRLKQDNCGVSSGASESVTYQCGADYRWDTDNADDGVKIEIHCPQSDGGIKAQARRDEIDAAVIRALASVKATDCECRQFAYRAESLNFYQRKGLWATMADCGRLLENTVAVFGSIEGATRS